MCAAALVSPCSCTGGQKWVHLKCLHRWQRSVLVTQPTHPAFYERDERQFGALFHPPRPYALRSAHSRRYLLRPVCQVCKSPFTIEPPSRSELMVRDPWTPHALDRLQSDGRVRAVSR
jgi:hypothetical protein